MNRNKKSRLVCGISSIIEQLFLLQIIAYHFDLQEIVLILLSMIM